LDTILGWNSLNILNKIRFTIYKTVYNNVLLVYQNMVNWQQFSPERFQACKKNMITKLATDITLAHNLLNS